MIYNKIPAVFSGTSRIAVADPVNYQYDVTQILVISGLELPEYYEVDFCNVGDTQTVTMIGTDDGVAIPDSFLATGKKIKAYIVVQGEDDGAVETRYEVTIPVNKRPERTDIQPTPAEQQQIDSIIETMNECMEEIESAVPVFERGSGKDSIISKCSEIANTASGESATAIGRASVASGKYSFAGGNRATGYGPSTASGDCAFAYGATTVASETCSVALGMCVTASGSRALAAGFWTEASANQAQAFGQRTIANAPMSTAFGNYTIASGRACFVAGQYNVEDTNEIDTSHGSGARKYIFIVGNGTAANARSNALALDWDGHLVVAADPVEDMGVVTKRYVDSALSNDVNDIKTLLARGTYQFADDGNGNITVSVKNVEV